MVKRLFVCCDGTWNAPTDLHDGVPVPTNVVRFYNALAETDKNGVEQRRYYHPGVGTQELSMLDRMISGMTGRGLNENVKSAYAWLTANYDPQDEIFLLGFSRGAFTARSLSGFIASQGIHAAPPGADGSRSPDWKIVEAAYSDCEKERARKRSDPRFHFPDVEFLGVWDTVGALGIPPDFPNLPLKAAFLQPRFHDTELSPNVRHAYHALALDEMRRTFSPTLWTQQVPTNQEVVQMWFSGVHADVGGGYRETGLSDIALDWMIERATALGADFRPHMLKQIQGDAKGVMHDSRLGLFSRAITQPRRIPDLDPQARRGPHGQEIHVSVFERQGRPPIFQAPYRDIVRLLPGQEQVVTAFAFEKWNWTGIYVEAPEEYEISASGQWLHSGKATGPDGYGWSGYVSQRRYFDRRSPWLALAGAVADFVNPNQEGQIKDLEMFAVGRFKQLPIDKIGARNLRGYLYFFANVQESQFNANRGSLEVKVRRIS